MYTSKSVWNFDSDRPCSWNVFYLTLNSQTKIKCNYLNKSTRVQNISAIDLLQFTKYTYEVTFKSTLPHHPQLNEIHRRSYILVAIIISNLLYKLKITLCGSQVTLEICSSLCITSSLGICEIRRLSKVKRLSNCHFSIPVNQFVVFLQKNK